MVPPNEPHEADASPSPRRGSRIDLHTHSMYSKDALGSLDQIAAAATTKGLDGVALTDHNTVQHHAAITTWNEENGDLPFQFYPGIEVSARGGHILAFGIHEPIPIGRSVVETVRRIQDDGGVACPAHPFRRGSGIGLKRLEEVLDDLFVVEVWNAQDLLGGNKRAARWAITNTKGGTGGSDCHQIHDVGNAHTEFMTRIEHETDLVKALKEGNTWGVGGHTAPTTLLRQGTRNLVRRVRGQLKYDAE
jgi:predicted metal-dependent phosphoesterase TrpH